MVQPVRDDAFRRFVERLMPWYSREQEAERDAKTEAIRQRSIRARIQIERMTRAELHHAYRIAGRRFVRRCS